MFRTWTLLLSLAVAGLMTGDAPAQQQSYQPVRNYQLPTANRAQLAAAQFPARQQQQMLGAVERRAMQDVHRTMIEDNWQQMRNQSSARLAARYNAPGYNRASAEQRGSTASPRQFAPNPNSFARPTQSRYADPRIARRSPPNYGRPPQSASQDDPFGEVQNDPFSNEPQDPFGEPPADTPPMEQPAQNDPFGQQTPDPFDEPRQPTQQPDPFGQMPNERPIDPFAEPPTQDPTNPPVRQPGADPRLPGGMQEVPEVPRDSQELPVPPARGNDFPQEQDPRDIYPPESMQPPGGEGEPRITPSAPTPATTPTDARPIASPTDQLYPGQIAPDPFTQAPVQPRPSVNQQQPYAGSPAPYMPGQAPFGPGYNSQGNFGPAPGYAPDSGYAPAQVAPNYAPQYGVPNSVLDQTPDAGGFPPIVSGSGQYMPPPGANANQIYPGQLPSIVEGGTGMPMVDDCSTCSAFEECTPQFYLSLFGGIEDIGSLSTIGQTGELFFDKGRGYGVALGALQGYNLRTDFEFTYRKSELSNVVGNLPFFQNGEIESYTGMANMYWEFMSFPKCCWKPYVGAGLGFGVFDNTSDNGNDHDSAFAYQYMIGMNYKYSQMMDLFGEYRVLHADDLDFTGTELDFKSDNFFVGLRMKF